MRDAENVVPYDWRPIFDLKGSTSRATRFNVLILRDAREVVPYG